MATVTLRPTSGSGTSWSNIENAYDTSTSTTATVSVSSSNYSSRTATFNFDISEIPSNAIINSATLTIICKGSSNNRITLYADINGSSSSRVINSSCSTSTGNKTADVISYMSNLNSIKLTGYNSRSSSYTLSIYDINIEVTYELPKATYTITFKDWDGTTLKTQTVEEGSSATPPSNPTRTGYTFTGWLGSYTNVQSNVTITAQYSINTYTVTFKDWNGTTLKTQTVNHGSSATAPSNPIREGYEFTGWSGSYTNVTSNLTIMAQYEEADVENLKIGNIAVNGCYIGEEKVIGIYLGNFLIYSKK